MDAGIINQVKGPFITNYSITLNSLVKIGISMNEKDFMASGEDFHFKIIHQDNSEADIKIGTTQMFELLEPIYIKSLVFPDGAPASVIVEYTTYIEE